MGEMSETRNPMRRSMERSSLQKSLMDLLTETVADIFERYEIGVAGGSEKAGE